MPPPKGKTEKQVKEILPPKSKDSKQVIVAKKHKLKASSNLKNNACQEAITKIVKNSSKKSQVQKSITKITSTVVENEVVPSPSNSDDVMEWEPTEHDIIKTLQEIRREDLPLSINSKIIPDQPRTPQASSSLINLIIDTNIFLSQLHMLKKLVEDESISSKVLVHIPWVVLQELDYIKSNKREGKTNLELVARKAGTFIFENIRKKNSSFRVQTLDEFKHCIDLLSDENSDDKILQWCLHLKKETMADVYLLSNDILFCAKASACGIQVFQSNNFIQELPRLYKAEVFNTSATRASSKVTKDSPSVQSSSNQINSNLPSSNQQFSSFGPEKISAIDFCQQFERVIVDPLSQVLEYEMKQAFDDIWLHLVLLKPPWTFSDILKCIEKHWVAVFDYVYPRNMRDKLDHVSNLWKKCQTNTSDIIRKQCEMLIEQSVSLLQLILSKRKQFHLTLTKAIEELRVLLDENDVSDETLLGLLNRLWERFNFICGTLSDAAGIHHHGLVYKAGSIIPDHLEMVEGLRMLLPLLSNLESAMSGFLITGSEVQGSISLVDCSNKVSNCLMLAANQLGISSGKSSSTAISKALQSFASNSLHREKMQNGLEQLRIYLQVLHSVSSRFASSPESRPSNEDLR